MPDAIVKLGWSNAEAQKGAQEAVRLAQNTQQQMAKALANTGGSGGTARIGQASLQFQDIAVQMQSGTKMSTILAQQGSQLASIFGPGGMIIGGLAAVGGLVYSTGQKSIEMFDGMVKGAADLQKEINGLIGSGGFGGLNTAVGKADAQLAAFVKQRESVRSLGGALTTALAMPMGGLNTPQKMAMIDEAEAQLMAAKAQAQQAMLAASATELRIAEARAMGREKEADEMERQLALAKKLADIERSNATPEMKAQLAQDAARLSEANQDRAKNPTGPSATQKRYTELIAELNKAAVEALPDAEKFTLLNQLQQKRLSESVLLAQLEKQRTDGDLKGATATLELLKQRRDTAKELAEISKRMMDQGAEAAQKQAKIASDAAKETKERRKKNREESAKQDQAQTDLGGEMAVLALRAQGREKEADALQRQLDILKEAREIQDQLGISAETALQVAIRKADLEQQATDQKGKAEASRNRQLRAFPGGEADDQSGPARKDGRAHSRIRGYHGGDADAARARHEANAARVRANIEKRFDRSALHPEKDNSGEQRIREMGDLLGVGREILGFVKDLISQ